MVLFRAMSDPSFTNPTPQFGTAEYVGSPGGDHCQFCHQPIASTYYRTNGAISCASCADGARREIDKDSHSAFVRAIMFGAGAAILGLVLYAAFSIITGIMIGYIAVAIGWIVGKAMLQGSGGATGRRYQVVAVVLTYLAITLGRIPVWIHYSPRLQADPVSVGLRLIPVAIMFPFTRLADLGFGGVMGLIILFVGVSIAARMTAPKPLEIFGPFENAPSTARS